MISPYPDTNQLIAALRVMVGARPGPGADIAGLERRPNEGESTYPSEVIECRLSDGNVLTLFCKYGRDTGAAQSFGHSGGVAYEASVYGDVLRHLEVPTPTFYGSHVDPTGSTWLVLAHVPDSVRVGLTPDLVGFDMAAEWLGRFHTQAAARLEHARELHRYTPDYYAGWARRTVELAARTGHSRPWLAALCDRFEREVIPCLTSSDTVVHGEFYPSNILCLERDIVAVDWESAAIGPGEIDLATLMEGWTGAELERCLGEYARVRWPDGRPQEFEARLEASRLYVQFRWLGQDPQWTAAGRYRFDALRTIGERMGLL